MHGPINVKSPNNISKWQMEFNSAFKGLKYTIQYLYYAGLGMYREWKTIEFQKKSIIYKFGRLDGGKGWKERVYDREKLKKLLRMARNHHILHMSMQ
jgi:hypothetical protein